MRRRILLAITALPYLLSAATAGAGSVRIDLPAVATYQTVTEAYAAAADGATIRLEDTAFVENVTLSAPKAVRLAGGYYPDFSAVATSSTINGRLTVAAGNAVLSDLVIGPSGGVPGVPTGVSATLGAAGTTVIVSASALSDGGSPVTSYTATSSPAGISATGASLPLTVSCPTTCAGYAIVLSAVNANGSGAPSAPVEVVTDFDITETFLEPQTQPYNSIFVGSFTYNSTSRTVSALKGNLSESMTGVANGTMNLLYLANQLVSWRDSALGGTFAAVFRNGSTNTFTTLFGGDGWSPQAGISAGGVYYGFPTAANNPGNAYALVFVPDTPTKALSQAQIDKLAYADCAPDGMMGAVCMTGTTVAGYGFVGSMGGYPSSQVITKH